jgi:hypothetical protein
MCSWKFDLLELLHAGTTLWNFNLPQSETLINSNMFQEISKSFKFGLGICIAKTVLPRMGKLMRNPFEVPRTLLRKFDYGLMAFIVGINGIFKVTKKFIFVL